MSFTKIQIIGKKKRKRSENWETDEKLLLRQIIEEKIDIIDDKRTDTVNCHRKRDAWLYIVKRFNSLNKRKRELNQLQFQWRNSKIRSKVQVCGQDYKRPSTNSVQRSLSPKLGKDNVEIIIPKEEFEVADFDVFQSDTQDEQLHDFDYADEEEIPVNNLPLCNEPIVSNYAESSKSSSPELPLSREVPRKKPKPKYVKAKDEFYKRELYMLAKKVKQSELMYMREIHEAQLKTIKMERELRMRCMQEEHDAKMDMIYKNKLNT